MLYCFRYVFSMGEPVLETLGFLMHTYIRASIEGANSVAGEDEGLGHFGGRAASARFGFNDSLEDTSPRAVSDGRNQPGFLFSSTLVLVNPVSTNESGAAGRTET